MIDGILNKDELNKDDIISLLKTEDKSETISLFAKADEIREKYFGSAVHLRGIIEFSNYCAQNCLYCGLRKGNKRLQRYRMNKEEILLTAENIYKNGIRTIVLQSGEDFAITGEDISKIIKLIKNNFDVAITLSLGERDFEEYRIWKEAGADRYLLKHETASPNLYSIYHSLQKLEERLEHLRILKSLGYQIGSGNLVGLPYQKVEDIAEDILLCKQLDVDMASFSPFIPSSDTPYGSQMPAEITTILKVMAIGRIVLKNTHIPSTTALAVLDKYGWEKGLRAGANVIMPNFTPQPYREQYSIYPDKKLVPDAPSFINGYLNGMLDSLGRYTSKEKGQTLKRNIPE